MVSSPTNTPPSTLPILRPLGSPDWNMTSGSLYARDGSFWTGSPDSLRTQRQVDQLHQLRRLPARFQAEVRRQHPRLIGPHAACRHRKPWLRFRRHVLARNPHLAQVPSRNTTSTTPASTAPTARSLLSAKYPCGDDNSGTYFVIGEYTPHSFHQGSWNHYATTIQTNPDSSVTIKLYDTDSSGSTPVLVGTDHGGTNSKWSPRCTTAGRYPTAAYQPITAGGGIGIRGDYANFLFRDLVVSRLLACGKMPLLAEAGTHRAKLRHLGVH